MKTRILLNLLLFFGLAACSAPSSTLQIPRTTPAESKVLPTQDGTYHIVTHGCGDMAHFEVHGGIASFTSPYSGAKAQGPVNRDGSFNIKTPSTGTYGVTSLAVDPDGKGTFTVYNRYKPCTGIIDHIFREQ